jgi:HKD family nuclease
MARKPGGKINLHEALNHKSYDHALICTFTFEASFFEEYCLEKFSTLSNNGNITVLVDSNIYEKAILAPESMRPRKANIRYLLHPVSCPRGVFHPKIVLLASKNKGKLILGSSNFTRPGLTLNAEMSAVFEFEAEKEENFKPLFQSVFKYLAELSLRWPGENLASNISDVERDASWLTETPTASSSNTKALPTGDAVFLDNLERPLWEQIMDIVPAPIDNIYILSRFFDGSPGILDRVWQDFAPKKIKIFTQNGITNLTPEWLDHPLVQSGQAEIQLCRFTDEDYGQPLHAKCFVFEAGNDCYLFFGSANFTTAALFRTPKNGNAETLLSLPLVLATDLQPQKLFDPEKSAVQLKSKEMLKTAASDTDEFENREKRLIKLLEAASDNKGERISIRTAGDLDADFDRLTAVLTFTNQASKIFEVQELGKQKFSINISAEDYARLNTHSTIIQLRAIKENVTVAESNSLLIINLMDIKTDRPLRRERHIKEAQQNAEQFFIVLRDLLGANDDEALLSFLNFCDIPFNGTMRPVSLRGAKTVWSADGMRVLGEKNLKVYSELHEAALSFYDKHFRKLQRHVKSRNITAGANFTHIFLAMGGILRSQVERVVIGLEDKKTPLTGEQWRNYRDHLDTYYFRYRQLMDCLWREYLSPLQKEYQASEIKEQFAPDLEPIKELVYNMMDYRERLNNLRNTKLRLVNPSGQQVIPPYFHCILGMDYWPGYAVEVNKNLDYVERAIA